MKLLVLTAALAASASAIALPAAAQSWTDYHTYLNDNYVQVNGGTTTEGRSMAHIAATGLGTASESASLRDAIFASALVGRNITPAIAVELEGVYSRNHLRDSGTEMETDGGALRTYGALANAKLRIPYTASFHQFAITPYVAGGIGYGNAEYGASDGNVNRDGFMWQGKAGLEIKTGLPVSFDVGYRYLQAPDYTTPGSFYNANLSGQVKSSIQAVTLGARYSF